MSVKVSRPEGSKKKINSKEEFELCYLRHKYIRRTKRNPVLKEVEPYKKIIKHQSYNTYTVYSRLFGSVGLDVNDIRSIGDCHLVSFLGSFALERNKAKLEAFKKNFYYKNKRYATKKDVLDKNKADFTSFLKQRFTELVRISRQKAANVRGVPMEEFKVFVGTKKPPLVHSDLLLSHEEYGYKRLDVMLYKTAKKRAGVNGNKSFKDGNKYYIVVEVDSRDLTEEDIEGSDMSIRNNLHSQSPESIAVLVEDAVIWEGKKEQFNAYAPEKRLELIENFITNHKENPEMEEELKAARAMLRSAGVFK